MAIAELANSRRRYPKAVFTPLRLAQDAPGGDVAVIAGVLRSLEVTPEEIEKLREGSTTDAQKVAVEALARLASAGSADQGFEAAQGLAQVAREDLVALVKRVQTLRADALAQATRALNTPAAPAAEPPARTTPSPGPLARRFGSFLEPKILLSNEAAVGVGAAEPRFVSSLQRAQIMSAGVAAGAGNAPAGAGSNLTMSFIDPGSVITAAARANFDVVGFIKAVAPYLPPGSDVATLDPVAALDEIDRRRRTSEAAIDALSRRTLEPLGLLHLESLEMTPMGVERGELLYSLPLAPKEKVTLSHKEWAVRETELTDYVQDYLENYSERGVAETDEIAIASQTETQRTDRTSVGPSGGVVVTSPVDATPPAGGASTVVTNTKSAQESRRSARNVTSRATSRAIRDHKISFTVATTAGTEDFTARLIENPSADRSMRIDYYRRVRLWKVDLFRVGVRMTYDVVIPDPGRRLRSRQDLLRRYDAALAQAFDPKVKPWDIDAGNWDMYASAYGAVLTPPPATPAATPAFQQWQMSSYATLRDAAFARFVQVQETIRQRRADLARQIDTAADALTLRQMEREQVMRSVLEWLVPGFSVDIGTDPMLGVAAGISDDSWQRVMEYGEYIKFIHSAIDWANVTYLLYPYFWGTGGSGSDKLYLTHPDATHREFLRAGAARVILPIQPGFEAQVAALLDQGRLGALPAGHRFLPVIEQVQNAQAEFARQGDPAPDGANPVPGSEPRGTLIGSWTEWTPTGALDLEVTTMPVNAAP